MSEIGSMSAMKFGRSNIFWLAGSELGGDLFGELRELPAVYRPDGDPGGARMEEKRFRLGPREQQIVELLLQGCDNVEIAQQLGMAPRTVKAHFNRLFLRFGINTGIKRVKLATLLYRRQLCLQAGGTEVGTPTNESSESSNLLPKGLRTVKSPVPLEPPNTLSKTIFASSTISSGSGIGSNLLSGTKPDGTRRPSTPETLEEWEERMIYLGQDKLRDRGVLD